MLETRFVAFASEDHLNFCSGEGGAPVPGVWGRVFGRGRGSQPTPSFQPGTNNKNQYSHLNIGYIFFLFYLCIVYIKTHEKCIISITKLCFIFK